MQELKPLTKIVDTDFMGVYESWILAHTEAGGHILIPYMSVGHFAFESAINERKCLVYDNNPLIRVNFESEFFYPSLAGIKARLGEIRIIGNFPESEAKRFLDPKTYDEVMSIRTFLENAPKDAINLWIKRLVSETLKVSNEILNGVATPQYYDVKESALRIYKSIFSYVDPMKILILHEFVPVFFENEGRIEEYLNGQKVKMAYYAPYAFSAEQYFRNNFLKLWFFGITKEQLFNASINNTDELRVKKDFVALHKKLESAGMMVIEKIPNYNIESFLKLALFYGYENIKSYVNSKGAEVYLMRKLGI